MGNRLMVKNTGLDHLYVNGVPIIEVEFNMSDIYKKVARISSLAVQGDPYFNLHTAAQKLFSEIHGEGDRISRDFLEDGAKDILPVFQALQRWIPEGVFDVRNVDYDYPGQLADFLWNNPLQSNNSVLSIDVRCTSGNGDLTFYADFVELGTVTLPEYQGSDDSWLSYDLAGFLGGEGGAAINYFHSENLRNVNIPGIVEARISNASDDFAFDVIVRTIQYDGITWQKALLSAGDVKYPTVRDNIVVSYLLKSFAWNNINQVDVFGVTLKKLAGSAFVTINTNLASGTQQSFDANTHGEDFSSVSGQIENLEIVIEEASDDFQYHLTIETGVPDILPSPRFEFDSGWNEGKIIYRWQNMDNRADDQKLNYTSETLVNIRIDTNIIENVKKYLADALRDFVLKELYRAVGYDKKYLDYARSYEQNRQYVAWWVKNDTSRQTQYHYAGI